MLIQAGKYIGNVSAEKLGDELNEKRLDNSSNWHVIKVNDKTYDTGWNYIKSGTELKDYGQAKNDWLVNYETGEIIQLKEDKYMSLSAGDMVAIKDSLIVNVDSSIIDEGVENKKGALEKQLGENVKLVNFDYNTESGLTNTSFNFDGQDDYIKVQYDKQEQKDALAKNGFTFEFYGIWNGGSCFPADRGSDYRGLFSYWNGEEKKQAQFRFGLREDSMDITSNVANGLNLLSDFSVGGDSAWNIRYPASNMISKDKVLYMTIVLDASNKYNVTDGEYVHSSKSAGRKNGEFYKQAVYINGNLLYEGDYNAELWKYFCEKELPNLKYFCLGRSSMTADGYWNYAKMTAYALRLYSRGLSKEEVMQNYEKSVEYHSLTTN